MLVSSLLSNGPLTNVVLLKFPVIEPVLRMINELLASSIGGACLCFKKFNGHPAKMHMGDGGSYFLGFSLAYLSIFSLSKPPNTLNVILSLLIIFLPIFDMIRVILLRIIKGKSPFHPDRNHIHHILRNMGLSHQNTVDILLKVVLFFITLSIFFINAKYALILSFATFFLILSKVSEIFKLNK